MRYEDHFMKNVLPNLEQSSVSACFFDGKIDPKIAIEVGASVLLDKPMIAMVQAGTSVPEKMVRVFDEIVEVDATDHEGTSVRLMEAIERVNSKQG